MYAKPRHLYLASMAAQTGLSLPWSQTPEPGFLVTKLIKSSFPFHTNGDYYAEQDWKHNSKEQGMIQQHKPQNVIKWAASWQNQQSDCAPGEDSDQPGGRSVL